MSGFVLRDYQHELVQRVRREMAVHRRVVLQSPTGSGKTVLTAHMIGTAAERGKSAWFVVHRKELLDQTSAALWESDVPHGVIGGGRRTITKDRVQVATIQTLSRRLDRVDKPDLIIIDEAHHTAAASYRKVIDRCPESYVVGLTATPVRTDGRGLDDLFNSLVPGPTVQDLTQRGYLAPYKLIAPPSAVDLSGVRTRAGDFVRKELEVAVDQGSIVGNAVEHYLRHVVRQVHGRPPTCLVYCVSRAHARHVEAAYRSAGINARYCAGDTPKAERNAIVRGFRRGNPQVIVSVDLFGEGLDVPGLAAVQLLRPTQSLTLHLQQIGRALRPEQGKEHAVVLDHVGNTWRHGLPDDEREWTLEGTRGHRRSTQEEEAPAIRVCDNCFAVYRTSMRACPFCGAATPAPDVRLPDEVDGELEEIDAERHRALRRREEGQAARAGLRDLVLLAMERDYKAAWAGIRYAMVHGEDKGRAISEAKRIWREITTERMAS